MANLNQLTSPYLAGTILTISPHTPDSVACAESHDYTAETTQLVQRYKVREIAAPASTIAPSHESDAPFRKLDIVGPIAVGRDKAQVVLCKADFTPGQQPTYLAAKIFDIRCYGEDARWDGNGVLAYRVKCARVEYSREAAAYERIKAHESTRPSRCTLDCFGAWSFQLIPEPPPSPQTAPSKICDASPIQTARTVHVILLEYIEGCDLHDILYSRQTFVLDDEYRLNVWSQFAECQIWLEHIGIYHEDIVEHNVMVSPAPLPTLAGSGRPITQPHPRAVLIDFGEADVEDPGHDTANLPESPIVRYWKALCGLAQWCPDRFVGYIPERRKWIMKKYGQDPRYQKVDLSMVPYQLDKGDRMYMGAYGYE